MNSYYKDKYINLTNELVNKKTISNAESKIIYNKLNKLKLLVDIEDEYNQILQTKTESENQIKYQEYVLDEQLKVIKSQGYIGDGCLSDYKKLYNNPAIYGKHHDVVAIDEYNNATDKLSNFIQTWLRS